MRSVLRIVLVAVLVLAAGCSSGGEENSVSVEDGDATTTTEGVETTTTAAPSGDTTTSAPGAPTLTDESKVTTVGLDKVFFGMTVAEAEAAAGTTMTAGEAIGDCQFVTPEAGPEGVSFMVTNGRIERVDISSGPVTTRSGAGIGMTEDEIKALFPDQIEVLPHQYVSSGHYLTFVPKDEEDAEFRIIFETDGSVVTSFRAGRLPEVAAVEGCA